MWIYFDEDISEIFGTEYRFLMPLNKINILIGRNNSGPLMVDLLLLMKKD